jgi:hypothetical protein
MKKILLFTLFLANFFYTTANTRMSAYRWRNDNGNETTATWKVGINTSLNIKNLDPIRLRIALEDYSTGQTAYTGNFYKKIQFSEDSGATWKNFTDSGSPFSLISSSEVADAVPTTQQISTGNYASFIVGAFVSTDSNQYISYPASTGKFTELEFSIKPNASISSSIKYTFQVLYSNSNLVIPELTYCPTPEPTATSPQNFNVNAKVSDLTATGTDLKWYTAVTGGTALDPITPLSSGLYYVSQTLSCESTRSEVQVNVNLNGSSLNFAGGYVDLPINMPATYTKEAWIKVNDFSPVNNIISGGSDGEHAIYIPGGKLSSGHNSLWESVQDSEVLDTDTWYHVAVTYDLATTTMILYKNGVAIAENNSVQPFNGNAVRIGAFDPGGNLFNGTIDEARIWSKVLTQAEIQNNMNCELSGTQPGLVSYYKFNQGFEGADNSTVTALTDSSGNGNDGTLINFDLSTNSSNWISGSIIQTGNSCTTLSVGDHNLDFNSSLKVYPNPSSSAFFINSDSNGTIVLFDLLGKIIQTQKLNSGTTTLDLGSTQNGVYLLKVTNEKNQSKTVKLIKN